MSVTNLYPYHNLSHVTTNSNPLNPSNKVPNSYTVGLGVGFLVGLLERNRVGLLVGLMTGLRVGLLLGRRVGFLLVGRRVGLLLVGRRVGFLLVIGRRVGGTGGVPSVLWFIPFLNVIGKLSASCPIETIIHKERTSRMRQYFSNISQDWFLKRSRPIRSTGNHATNHLLVINTIATIVAIGIRNM